MNTIWLIIVLLGAEGQYQEFPMSNMERCEKLSSEIQADLEKRNPDMKFWLKCHTHDEEGEVTNEQYPQ